MHTDHCMIFDNAEIEEVLLKRIEGKFDYQLMIHDSYVIKGARERYEYVMLDDARDFYISFMGFQTSVFIFDTEFMFIDEHAKSAYTISDTYGNIVYDGKLNTLSHKQILNLICDLVMILSGAIAIDVESKKFPDASDFYPRCSYDIKVHSDKKHGQELVLDNIRIKIL